MTRNECSLYLAPSSIPNAGFGIYATESISMNDLIMKEPDAPSITICDESLSKFDNTHWLFHDYIWDDGGVMEFECDEAIENIISFSMSNYHAVSFEF